MRETVDESVTPENKLSSIQSATNDAAQHANVIYLTFLLLCGYLSIVVASTTDEQLLRGSTFKLPILNASLPIFSFYWVAPFLLLLVHINLLIHLHMLSTRVASLRRHLAALEDTAQADQWLLSFPFPFTAALAPTYTLSFRFVMRSIVWLTVYALPIYLFLHIELRFAPYRDVVATEWHAIALACDMAALLVFWAGSLSMHSTLPAPSVTRRVSLTLSKLLHGIVACSLLALAFVVAFSPIEERYPLKTNSPRWGGLGLLGRRFVDVSEQVLTSGTLSIKQSRALGTLNDRSAAWRTIGPGVVLRGRDLRFGRFRYTWLVNADLRDADMRDTDLEGAYLHGANLAGARLQGARLSGARLDGASLVNARLQHTQLDRTVFTGADLRGAGFEAAAGVGANFQGTLATGAVFVAAELPHARFDAASLDRARFVGANLWRATFEGGNLEGVDLRAADVRQACFKGSQLAGAKLRADFQGSDVSNADLERVDLSDVPSDVVQQVKDAISPREQRMLLPDGVSSAGTVAIARSEEAMTRSLSALFDRVQGWSTASCGQNGEILGHKCRRETANAQGLITKERGRILTSLLCHHELIAEAVHRRMAERQLPRDALVAPDCRSTAFVGPGIAIGERPLPGCQHWW